MIVKEDNTANRRGMFLGSRMPMMMDEGTLPTHEKDMYIWKTVADRARGVASPISAILPPELILSMKFEMIAKTTNQVVIPLCSVIQRKPEAIITMPVIQ